MIKLANKELRALEIIAANASGQCPMQYGIKLGTYVSLERARLIERKSFHGFALVWAVTDAGRTVLLENAGRLEKMRARRVAARLRKELGNETD